MRHIRNTTAFFLVSALCSVLSSHPISAQANPSTTPHCATVATGTLATDTENYWRYAAVWNRPTQTDAESEVRKAFSATALHGASAGLGPYLKSTCDYAHGAVIGIPKPASDDSSVGDPSYYMIFSAFDRSTPNAITNATAECTRTGNVSTDQCKVLVQW
jgi:hypothetical protein